MSEVDNTKSDTEFAETSESLFIHADFCIKLDDLVLKAAVSWNRKRDELSRYDVEKTRYLFLNKCSRPQAEARRKYKKSEINLSRSQFQAIISICALYLKKDDKLYNDKFTFLEKNFHIYEHVNKFLDGRSNIKRGPRIMSKEQRHKCFWEIWDALQAEKYSMSNKEDLINFIDKTVSKSRRDGNYSDSIRNCRAILFMLISARHKEFSPFKDTEWGFIFAHAVRQGFYTAQQCEDLYNMDIFLHYADLSNQAVAEKTLHIVSKYMLLHRYALLNYSHSKWAVNFGEQGYAAKVSNNYLDGSINNYIDRDLTAGVNTALEFSRRGYKLSYKPDVFSGKNIEYHLKEAIDKVGLSNESAVEGKALASANYAHALWRESRHKEAQTVILSANAMLSTDDNLLFARARILEMIGELEKTRNNSDYKNYFRKARNLYLSLGAFIRARSVNEKMNLGPA